MLIYILIFCALMTIFSIVGTYSSFIDQEKQVLYIFLTFFILSAIALSFSIALL